MAVVSVEITERAPFADGAESGEAGPYERVDGLLTHAIDPANPANALITDLALARRGADGLVRFTGDFTLIAPVDLERGNGELLIDVVNRGRRQVMSTFNLAPPSRVGSSEIPLGDGFLCRRGYTVLSVGWQWDVPRSPAMMASRLLRPSRTGSLRRGRCWWRSGPTRRSGRGCWRTASTAVSSSRRRRTAGPAAGEGLEGWAVPGDSRVRPWRFAEETDAGVFPSASHITVEAGMEPGKIYHVVYTTDHAPVVGAGLLAVRDAAAWLKNGGNSLAAVRLRVCSRLRCVPDRPAAPAPALPRPERRRGGAAGVRRPASCTSPAHAGANSTSVSASRPYSRPRGSATSSRSRTTNCPTPSPRSKTACCAGCAPLAPRRASSIPTLRRSTGAATARSRTSTPRGGTTSTRRRSRARTSSPAPQHTMTDSLPAPGRPQRRRHGAPVPRQRA